MPNVLTKTIANSRAARAQRQHLQRERSSSTAPTQRLELLTVFARYPDEQTAEMREMLARKKMQLV